MKTASVAPLAGEDMAAEVLRGLRARPRRIDSKYFYDAPGSELFERICEQPEYYLTRAELALLQRHAGAIAGALGPRLRLAEFGCGSCSKTRLLLRQLETPCVYVPIELSASALAASCAALCAEFPQLPVRPLCADFSRPLLLPASRPRARRTVIYFPGSTIGNFEVPAAVQLMRQMRATMGAQGGALIGIDLRKPTARIEAAYNDAAGVTAAFTLNLLARFNRELGADFVLAEWAHRARYNPMAGRIETHLISRREQRVRLGGSVLRFGAGEPVLAEYSYKYAPDQFAAMALRAGLRVAADWRDDAGDFSLVYLQPEGA